MNKFAHTINFALHNILFFCNVLKGLCIKHFLFEKKHEKNREIFEIMLATLISLTASAMPMWDGIRRISIHCNIL